jgi:hypothetical protein
MPCTYTEGSKLEPSLIERGVIDKFGTLKVTYLNKNAAG